MQIQIGILCKASTTNSTLKWFFLSHELMKCVFSICLFVKRIISVAESLFGEGQKGTTIDALGSDDKTDDGGKKLPSSISGD